MVDRLAPVPDSLRFGQSNVTCAACGSTNIYFYPYTCEFCQCVCDDCDSPLNADGSVWVEKKPSLPVDVPESDTLFQYLTKGYSWSAVKAELESDDESLVYRGRMLLERAQRAWDQIRQESGGF